MNVLRLSWSSYQTTDSLKRERMEIESLGYNYVRKEYKNLTSDELDAIDVILINSGFNADSAFINKLKPGSLILTTTSGHDHVDIDEADKRNVSVARTPKSRARRVTSHTISMMYSFVRGLHRSTAELKDGKWTRGSTLARIRSLSDQKIGIIGYGVIGKKLAERLIPITESPLMVYDPLEKSAIEENPALLHKRLETIFETVDIITIHADLNDTTDPLLSSSRLKSIPDETVIINTARGAMIDYNELLQQLKNGSLGAAGLDVYPAEPPKNLDLSSDKLLLTPHSAGFGPGLLSDLRSEIVETLTKFRDGDPLPHRVTPRSEEAKQMLKGAQDDRPNDH